MAILFHLPPSWAGSICFANPRVLAKPATGELHPMEMETGQFPLSSSTAHAPAAMQTPWLQVSFPGWQATQCPASLPTLPIAGCLSKAWEGQCLLTQEKRNPAIHRWAPAMLLGPCISCKSGRIQHFPHQHPPSRVHGRAFRLQHNPSTRRRNTVTPRACSARTGNPLPGLVCEYTFQGACLFFSVVQEFHRARCR